MALPPAPRQRLYGSGTAYLATLWRLATSWPGSPDEVDRLAAGLSQFLGVERVVPVNQARVGIYLAVKAVVAEGRRKVLMSPYTIFDVVNMVVAAGGIPVFCDIDRKTLNLDPDSLAAGVDAEAAAVLVTHLHGAIADMDRIGAFCRAHDLVLIEDAAQALGAHADGRRAGTLGDIGALSFGLFKNVNSFFGGAVVTKEPRHAETIRGLMTDWPTISQRRLFRRVAYGSMFEAATWPPLFKSLTYWPLRYASLNDVEAINSRLHSERNPVLRERMPDFLCRKISPIQARLALSQLDRVDAHAAERIETARIYFDRLRGHNGIGLPEERYDGAHAYLQFPVQVPDRPAVLRALFRRGRDTAPQYLKNCAALPCFAAWARPCPNAAHAQDQVLLLPTYPGYGAAEAARTADALRAAIAPLGALSA